MKYFAGFMACSVSMLLMTGCGVSETAVTATAVAKSEAVQAEAARKQMDQITQQIKQTTDQQMEQQRQAIDAAEKTGEEK